MMAQYAFIFRSEKEINEICMDEIMKYEVINRSAAEEEGRGILLYFIFLENKEYNPEHLIINCTIYH